MFSNNITKLNQVLKKCSITSNGKRLASSYHTSHVFRTHPSEVESRNEEDIRINKIPNIKGFEILRNPKLNKVSLLFSSFLQKNVGYILWEKCT